MVWRICNALGSFSALLASQCVKDGAQEGTYFGCSPDKQNCFEYEIFADSRMSFTALLVKNSDWRPTSGLYFYPLVQFKLGPKNCYTELKASKGIAYNFDLDQVYRLENLPLSKNTRLFFTEVWQFMRSLDIVFHPGKPLLWLDAAEDLKLDLSQKSKNFLTTPLIEAFDKVHASNLAQTAVSCPLIAEVPTGSYMGYLAPNWAMRIRINETSRLSLKIWHLDGSRSVARKNIPFSFDTNACRLGFSEEVVDWARKKMQELGSEKEDQTIYSKATNWNGDAVYSSNGSLRFLNSFLVLVKKAARVEKKSFHLLN